MTEEEAVACRTVGAEYPTDRTNGTRRFCQLPTKAGKAKKRPSDGNGNWFGSAANHCLYSVDSLRPASGKCTQPLAREGMPLSDVRVCISSALDGCKCLKQYVPRALP